MKTESKYNMTYVNEFASCWKSEYAYLNQTEYAYDTSNNMLNAYSQALHRFYMACMPRRNGNRVLELIRTFKMNYFERGIDFTIEKLYEFSAACENWIIDFKFEKKTNKLGYRYFIPMDEFLDIYKKTAYKSELSSYYGRFLFSDYERLMKEMALWKHKPFAFNTFNTVFLPDDMINGAFAILEGLADNRMLMSLGNIPGLKITDKMGAI